MSVDVISNSPGIFDNTSGDMTSDFGNSGVASDSLTVLDSNLHEDGFENSLIEDGSCAATLSGDPNLGPLTGSPAYQPLNAPSLAIDAGDNHPIPLGISTDQAGNRRIIGDTVDLGAFEWRSDIFQDSFE